ncbi:potassium transporter Kup [Azospirillum baldaniorum]|uniref:Probable potassium transport system protein Kup n=2 Tax=Azospirillum baldaniorum TaxID=1064539 RepID=A0A9P1JRT1_9PROT|nr:potassium transporter Kup [Azospirillum baldaniorum]NUB06024.1 potassium transporter Kup [Azospirillum baldaniorum]TWA72305.1 KUP system potassium uptake protein [Azospirillum baldaniorum]TWA76843.1 KUP system potassium uptake protein [Azospirillum brasilense]CCC98564.1 low affinity potassium transporter (Kup family) [Azospirillum baldaniorum]
MDSANQQTGDGPNGAAPAANPAPSSTPPGHPPQANRMPALVLGALGVVYGDIGTSPLYTMRESFTHTGLPLDEPTILGILSLATWALIIVVTLKYVLLVMRADNKGEGGVLALGTLAHRGLSSRAGNRAIMALAILGMALFYGDSLITPAISVLSAVEGLKVVTPALSPYIVPITLAVLTLLFLFQRQGTGRVGIFFGPIMGVWFATLAVLGLMQVMHWPDVLRAFNPLYGAALFVDHGWVAFLTLGAVVLAVTGAEALYADMGHFGRAPIRIAWLYLVLPALLLNYFGQGAMLLHQPETLENPFFHLAPDWAQLPLVLLSTAATVIASQAVISGAFSLTRQAVQLGYLPRREIRHTSEHEVGQVYIPRNNWLLLIGVVILVIGFGSSSNLAAAYGVSVTGAMAIDTILAAVVAWRLWRWNPVLVVAAFSTLLVIDLALFGATLLKVPDGGWFPLLIAAAVYTLMTTWRRGRRILAERLYADALPMDLFLQRVSPQSPQRVAGTAVFMTGNPDVVPHALLHNIKHNRVLHERVVVMTVIMEEVPRVSPDRAVLVEKLGKGFFRVVLRFGYLEQPHIPRALERCRRFGLHLDMMETSFFLGRETLIPSRSTGLPGWREPAFILLSKTALSATEFFCIPPGRVVELGTQVEI